MRKIVLLTSIACLVMAFGFPASAAGVKYSIDSSHSEVGFKIKHLTISWVSGHFGQFSGSFTLPEGSLAEASVKAVIQTASIDTGVEKRDEHLRAADFFDAAKYPEMIFESRSVQDISGDRFKVVGDLTLHGVTKEVVLDAELTGRVTDARGNERIAFSATTVINRSDFGLTWSKALETGGLVVGDEVRISLEIQGIEEK